MLNDFLPVSSTFSRKRLFALKGLQKSERYDRIIEIMDTNKERVHERNNGCLT